MSNRYISPNNGFRISPPRRNRTMEGFEMTSGMAECSSVETAVPARVYVRDASGRVIAIQRRVYDDPLARVYASEAIGRAQYLAACKWRRCFEDLEISVWSGDAESTRRLRADLRRMNRAIGHVGEWLLYDVLIQMLPFCEVAKSRGDKGDKHGMKGWQAVFCAHLAKLTAAMSH